MRRREGFGKQMVHQAGVAKQICRQGDVAKQMDHQEGVAKQICHQGPEKEVLEAYLLSNRRLVAGLLSDVPQCSSGDAGGVSLRGFPIGYSEL